MSTQLELKVQEEMETTEMVMTLVVSNELGSYVSVALIDFIFIESVFCTC